MIGRNFENPWGIKTMKGVTRKMSSLLDSAVFPGSQGGPLEHVIGAKAIAFSEALDDSFKVYMSNVKKNAFEMGKHLMAKGYDVISGGTDNHVLLIDLRNKGVTGKAAENALVKSHITVNKNMVPFDDQSPFVTSGIRIGSAAITTRGLQNGDMSWVVDRIDDVISNIESEENLRSVGDQVSSKMSHYPLFQ